MAYGMKIMDAAGKVLYDSNVDTVINVWKTVTIPLASWVSAGTTPYPYPIRTSPTIPMYSFSVAGLDPMKHTVFNSYMIVDTDRILFRGVPNKILAGTVTISIFRR